MVLLELQREARPRASRPGPVVPTCRQVALEGCPASSRAEVTGVAPLGQGCVPETAAAMETRSLECGPQLCPPPWGMQVRGQLLNVRDGLALLRVLVRT